VTDQLKITDLDLSAYVDDELDADRAKAVEEAAARDAGLAARIAAYGADKKALKDIYAPLAENSIPSAWIELARAVPSPAARARRSWRFAGIAAAVALVVLGGLSLYELRYKPGPRADVVETALNARNARTAEKSVSVANLVEARRYDETLRGIIGINIHVPALDSLGYQVTGLKFYEHAAEIEYRDGRGHLFTIYLAPSDGNIRFDQFERDGLHVCVWQDDQLASVMAGTISAAMMQRLASMTYLGLTT
jgi:anti-sigma factor RsiW